MIKRGIVLAGGKGTRLQPSTFVTNKHLLPIINVPMICHPLATLRELGVEDVLLVSGGNHVGGFVEFLGDGRKFGMRIQYAVQEEAGGIAQALGLAEDYVRGDSRFVVVLGDNIFEPGTVTLDEEDDLAHLYLSHVEDNRRFGVPLFGGDNQIKEIVEKPVDPMGDLAVSGLYIYPWDVFKYVNRLSPSARGELEITDVNNSYVMSGRCRHKILPGFWSDCGTPESMVKTVNFVAQNGIDPYKYLLSRA